MSRFPELTSIALALSLASTALWAEDDAKPAGYWGFGEAATAEQIAGWDIDVRPDGKGLPPGSGSVEDGESLYDEQCAECHGTFGEGEGRYPSLAGGQGSLKAERPHKTVGSYWPYVSTLWDYVYRAMPFTAPQSLSHDETYAIVAYVLYLNELVEDDFVATQDNLVSVRLPNEANFIAEQRPDVQAKRCMKDCRDPAAIEIKSEAPLCRPTPVAAAAAAAPAKKTAGESIYDTSCAVCHSNGVGGAPMTGEAMDWSSRIAAGNDALYANAINGFQGNKGVMPPKGGFMNLSDDEVKAAVDYMVGQLDD